MSCACISIYRKERLDESYREILRRYQKYVIEDTCWFSIELEWHVLPSYTRYELQQIKEAVGGIPEQEIQIFGECDRIFVAAYEIIKHFWGLLNVNIVSNRMKVSLFPSKKIGIYKREYIDPENHDPDYYLVDHIFIRKFFAKRIEHNFEKFKPDPFLPRA